MKKTLLALAIPALLTAGTASASISLYEKDGLSVTAKGAVEIQYRQTPENAAFDENGEMRVDDGDLEFNVKQDLGNGYYAVSSMGFSVGEGDEGTGSYEVKNDELSVGFGGAFGELTFGRQCKHIDDISNVTRDFEAPNGQSTQGSTCVDQYIKYDYSNENFFAGLGYALDNNDDRQGGWDGKLGYTDGKFYAAAYGELATFDGDDAFQQYELETSYDFGSVILAADFGQYFADDAAAAVGASGADFTYFDVALGLPVTEKDTINAGYGFRKYDVDGDDTVHSGYINAVHKFSSNVRVYAEVAYEDNNVADYNEFGYTAGMEVKF